MIDWYYDKLPGSTFASALHQLRREGDVVRARALDGAMPIYYILGHQALADAFREGHSFHPAMPTKLSPCRLSARPLCRWMRTGIVSGDRR